jgi:hypothetical protein
MLSALASRELADIAQGRELSTYLEAIWQTYFADIPRVNEVQIAYCQPWKRRLGLIRLLEESGITFIGINALLQHQLVPEYVLLVTIAHELTHYTHGFGSPLPRRYRHPHANNVVNLELDRRGLHEERCLCDNWIDKEWFTFYDMVHQSGWIEALTGGRTDRRQRRDPRHA